MSTSQSDGSSRGLRIRSLVDQPGSPGRRIAVAGAENPEVLASLGPVVSATGAQVVLFGDPDGIQEAADEASFSLDHADVIATADGPASCQAAAREAHAGGVDALMKGLVQTSDFVRAILDRAHRLVPDGGLLSHVALFDVAMLDRPIIVTDAAITTATDAATRAVVVMNAVGFAHRLGIRSPRVGLVAASEKVSDKVPSTGQAVEVMELLSGRPEAGSFEVDGPFGLDVAISAAAARTKGIDSPVAGRADIVVLPSLDAANVMYKTLTQMTDAAVGAVVAGATVPVILTSRADSELTKYLSIRLALAVAGGARLP